MLLLQEKKYFSECSITKLVITVEIGFPIAQMNFIDDNSYSWKKNSNRHTFNYSMISVTLSEVLLNACKLLLLLFNRSTEDKVRELGTLVKSFWHQCLFPEAFVMNQRRRPLNHCELPLSFCTCILYKKVLWTP